MVLREGRPGDERLVAYFVPGSEPAPAAIALRRILSETLPRLSGSERFQALRYHTGEAHPIGIAVYAMTRHTSRCSCNGDVAGEIPAQGTLLRRRSHLSHTDLRAVSPDRFGATVAHRGGNGLVPPGG